MTHVASADQVGGPRLVEHDLGDAEQDRHHRDADAEACCEHGRPNRVRRQRPQRQPSDHAVALVLDAPVAHRQDTRATVRPAPGRA